MPMQCKTSLSELCPYFFGALSIGMITMGSIILKSEKLHETPELYACNVTTFEALSLLGSMREVNTVLSNDCHFENDCTHDNNATLIDKLCAQRCTRDFIATFINETQHWMVRYCERAQIHAGAQVLILFGSVLLFVLILKYSLDFQRRRDEKSREPQRKISSRSRGLSTHTTSSSFLSRLRSRRYHRECDESDVSDAGNENLSCSSYNASREMSPRSGYEAI